MDKIFIRNLEVFGILGIHLHEQRKPQLIRISLKASTDIRDAAENDNIHDTVNYSTLAKDITKFVEQSSFLTIEALVESLAKKILEIERVKKVWLRVEKPNAVPGADSVGVEINRKKDA